MFQACCKIEFKREGKRILFFELLHSSEGNLSFRNFTDNFTIELPRKVKVEDSQYESTRLDSLLKRGDEVKVELAYDKNFVTEFEGYIAYVKPTFPVKIECEDKMFLLKQIPVAPKSFENATVDAILQYINVKSVMNYKVIGSVSIGAWQITPEYDTAAKVLKKLKDDYPILLSFIRDGELVVGEPYDPSYEQTIDFAFGKNIISHELEYRRADEVKYRVKMISKNEDGKDTSVEIGDKEGDQRSFTEMNKTLDELKSLGQKYLELLKYDGYRGKFTAFGIPVVKHGWIVNLTDSEEKEKDGKYFVDGVTKTFGMDGYRQVIELGKKAS